MTTRFPLGQLVATPAAIKLLDDLNVEMLAYMPMRWQTAVETAKKLGLNIPDEMLTGAAMSDKPTPATCTERRNQHGNNRQQRDDRQAVKEQRQVSR
jgi:hypothetical protein